MFEPNIDTICIEDIAHALSHQCRFGGHLPVFYTVAEHCINTVMYVCKENALAALLHDASEAYLLDIPRPIKNKLSNYKSIEDNLMHLIAVKFGFSYPLNEEVKTADEMILRWEWDNIFLNNTTSNPLSPTEAKNKFLEVFNYLNK